MTDFWLADTAPHKPSTLLGQETTKSHNYLDYIMGPPTHATSPRLAAILGVYTGQTVEVVHRSTVRVITEGSPGLRCCSGIKKKHACLQFVFPRSIGGQTSYWQRWWGGRADSHCSHTCKIQTHKLALEQPSGRQSLDPSFYSCTSAVNTRGVN